MYCDCALHHKGLMNNDKDKKTKKKSMNELFITDKHASKNPKSKPKKYKPRKSKKM